jgi:enoyl-CoA hydratase
VSLTCEEAQLNDKALEVARKLAAGPQTAIRWTKYSLNNWLRMAGPAFDASLALEMMGFTGPEVKEGLASLREKRNPSFPKEPKDF